MIERGVGHWNRLVVVCAAILMVAFARSCTPREAHAQNKTEDAGPYIPAGFSGLAGLNGSTAFQFYSNGKKILTITKAGEIQLGALPATEAAREFSDQLKKFMATCDQSEETK